MFKVIVRLKGGLGNQLFCYAAAKGVAIRNNLELVIDNITGFSRDKKYHRFYSLANFYITARLATTAERLEPFERYRRAFAKWRSRRVPFSERFYIEQEFRDFDVRLFHLRPQRDIYIDGLWQSEEYFKDIEQIIRQDLKFKVPVDAVNQEMSGRITACENVVALHVRWFDSPPGGSCQNNVCGDYYKRAIAYARERVHAPHFLVFSDDPAAAVNRLSLPEDNYTAVSHNKGGANAYKDMWLMSQCRHFIMANSTFSWWGAWLSSHNNKLIIAPNPERFDNNNAWRVRGLLPTKWIQL